jgi:anti-sigma regulatory factor (Ser/Thr protein kinase)
MAAATSLVLKIVIAVDEPALAEALRAKVLAFGGEPVMTVPGEARETDGQAVIELARDGVPAGAEPAANLRFLSVTGRCERHPDSPCGAGASPDYVVDETVGVEAVVRLAAAAAQRAGADAALRRARTYERAAIVSMRAGSFRYRTLQEARDFASMLAQICPEPDVVEIGLRELLVNAVEHGNLEITGAAKRALIAAGRWREEVDRRLNDPHLIARRAEITVARSPDLIMFTITDEGPGFDPSTILEDAGDAVCGRGIALARSLCFEEVTFHGRGNQVVATVRLA